jgi:glyoxylase-like metal-dependent hydrolase (beta-lactamase superfamily II)
MMTLGPGLSFIDLQFLDTPRAIATAVLHGPGGVALVDPGPSSTLPALDAGLATAGIAPSDLTAVILTHIHLDHAGATGTLVRRNPRLRVYVHEKGAPHMADPAKLLASATRLYGDDMDRLWGEFLPVPVASLRVLAGGERIEEGGRSLEVAYTPGHASHHVSYFCREAGIAFVGDTAGVRRDDAFVLTPTPPPDIDLARWHESLALIGSWNPPTLFLTHFGAWSPAGVHLALLAENMIHIERLGRESLALDATDEAREAWFAARIHDELVRQVGTAGAQAYHVAGRFDLGWRGIARYIRKKGTG